MSIQVIISVKGTKVKGSLLEVKLQRTNKDGSITPLSYGGTFEPATRLLHLNEGLVVNIPEASDK